MFNKERERWPRFANNKFPGFLNSSDLNVALRTAASCSTPIANGQKSLVYEWKRDSLHLFIPRALIERTLLLCSCVVLSWNVSKLKCAMRKWEMYLLFQLSPCFLLLREEGRCAAVKEFTSGPMSNEDMWWRHDACAEQRTRFTQGLKIWHDLPLRALSFHIWKLCMRLSL